MDLHVFLHHSFGKGLGTRHGLLAATQRCAHCTCLCPCCGLLKSRITLWPVYAYFLFIDLRTHDYTFFSSTLSVALPIFFHKQTMASVIGGLRALSVVPKQPSPFAKALLPPLGNTAAEIVEPSMKCILNVGGSIDLGEETKMYEMKKEKAL